MKKTRVWRENNGTWWREFGNSNIACAGALREPHGQGINLA
jgi:nuclear transport factor 2 (NTF2) superfamily protein